MSDPRQSGTLLGTLLRPGLHQLLTPPLSLGNVPCQVSLTGRSCVFILPSPPTEPTLSTPSLSFSVLPVTQHTVHPPPHSLNGSGMVRHLQAENVSLEIQIDNFKFFLIFNFLKMYLFSFHVQCVLLGCVYIHYMYAVPMEARKGHGVS